MSPKKKQRGGRKEAAPLVIVGSNDVAPLQSTSPTSEELAQKSYREILAGFFEKLIRWQAIHEDKKYHRENYKYSDFEVLQTPQGLTISPVNYDAPLYGKSSPNRVMVVSRIINIDDTFFIDDVEHHTYNRMIEVEPGKAESHLLVSPEGRPLRRVEIKMYNDWKQPGSNTLQIKAEYTQYTNTNEDRYKGVMYEVEKGQIQIHRYLWFPLMSEEYATHLFNTIDALIPNTSTPTPQTEPKSSQEAAPKPLPSLFRLLRRRPAR